MLYGYHKGSGLSPRVTGAFCRGVGAPLLHISSYLEKGLPADTTAVATYGILRGTGLLFREAIERGIDCYYLDHAYFRESNHPFSKFGFGRTWYRVALNAHTASPAPARDRLRFHRYFADHYPLLPWRGGTGRYILVLPPTPAIKWLFNCSEWPEWIIEEIRAISDLPIVWREKPGSINVDARGFPNGTFDEPHPPRAKDLVASSSSLDDDLDQAAAVVCYNSNVAVEAIRRGIPVICGEHCPAFPIRFPLNALNAPATLAVEPDRQGWFDGLAWQQFSKAELKSGFAGRILGITDR